MEMTLSSQELDEVISLGLALKYQVQITGDIKVNKGSFIRVRDQYSREVIETIDSVTFNAEPIDFTKV